MCVCLSVYLCIINPLHGMIELCAVVGDGRSVLLEHSQQRAGLHAKHTVKGVKMKSYSLVRGHKTAASYSHRRPLV